MSFPMFDNGNGNGSGPFQAKGWVVTTTNGVVTKIERLDKTKDTRKELSADEYATLTSSYYAIYYLGIRDYVQAIASGNTDLAQAYYQRMTTFSGHT
jgi:spermidine/putrescine-binding protein